MYYTFLPLKISHLTNQLRKLNYDFGEFYVGRYNLFYIFSE